VPYRLPTRATVAGLGVISLGGGAGSMLRYQLSRWVPPTADGFPTATLIINLTGAFALGLLVVAVTEVWRPHPLLRPALGTGVLGGYTTFSTFAVEVRGLSVGVATAYVVASVAGGLLLAATGMVVVRSLEPHLQRAPTHSVVDPLDPDLP
jgi:fluoride exporter